MQVLVAMPTGTELASLDILQVPDADEANPPSRPANRRSAGVKAREVP